MMEKVKGGELVLLLSRDESHLIKLTDRKLNTRSGIIDLSKIVGKKYGKVVKSHMGKEFTVVKPSIGDILEKLIKRGPQVIVLKDMGIILASTGIGKGSLVVDAGTGSGFLSIFLASYIKPGKVITYEIDKRFVRVAKENIRNSGLKKYIRLKEKDVRKGIDERNVDLVTLDMKGAEEVIEHAYRALKPGGWLVVYSPNIEQVIAARKEIEKEKFCEVKTVENIVREWQVEKFTRPKTIGLLHTGFLTFARKVG